MLRRITMGAAAAAFGLTALLAAPAQAGCENIFITQDVAGTVYVDLRANGDLWIYLESNSVEGLQRGGGGGVTTLSATDDCQQSANPDTILY